MKALGVKKNFSSKTEGLLNFSDLKKMRFKLLYGFMFAILVIIGLICILPTIWVFLSGFKSVDEMYAIPPTLIPHEFHFENLATAWVKVNFGKYFVNTIYLILGCLFFDIIVNGLAGYVLSRVRPKGSAIIETLIFWSMLLPGISMVPLYMTFVNFPVTHWNFSGSYIPLWLMAGTNAFNIFLFRNFFNSIPMSYLEAARIDGCSNIGIFMRIILPLSKPIVAVVAIFSITGTWSNFMWPYLLLDDEHYTVAVKLYQLSLGTIKNNELMLIMMLSIIPPAIIYMLFSKHIMGGVSMSGLKG